MILYANKMLIAIYMWFFHLMLPYFAIMWDDGQHRQLPISGKEQLLVSSKMRTAILKLPDYIHSLRRTGRYLQESQWSRKPLSGRLSSNTKALPGPRKTIMPSFLKLCRILKLWQSYPARRNSMRSTISRRAATTGIAQRFLSGHSLCPTPTRPCYRLANRALCAAG